MGRGVSEAGVTPRALALNFTRRALRDNDNKSEGRMNMYIEKGE